MKSRRSPVQSLRDIAEVRGHQVFGLAALLIGIAGIALHSLQSNWPSLGDAAFTIATSIVLMVGGVAMQFPKTDKLGAIAVGVVYLLFALTLVPQILAQPRVYASWGNVFYQLALVAGAMVAYGLASPSGPLSKTICRLAVVIFGLSAASFAVEQLEFLDRTISLVPTWIPPGGMFWAIATTIAFGLAAVSLISGYKSLLASQLMTSMLLFFVVAIWIPRLVADPRSNSNWSEGVDTFAIAAAAWLIAGFLNSAYPIVHQARQRDDHP